MFRSVNWIRKEACPIQVTATSPNLKSGKVGGLCSPRRLVNNAFQTSSRKNLAGAKCLEGVNSLNDRGICRFRFARLGCGADRSMGAFNTHTTHEDKAQTLSIDRPPMVLVLRPRPRARSGPFEHENEGDWRGSWVPSAKPPFGESSTNRRLKWWSTRCAAGAGICRFTASSRSTLFCWPDVTGRRHRRAWHHWDLNSTGSCVGRRGWVAGFTSPKEQW